MAKKAQKKLYRSRANRMISGVCGGFGEYFNIDPTIIRVIAAFLLLFGGVSFLVYIILWIVIPQAPLPRKSRIININ